MKLEFAMLWFDDNPEFYESLDLDPLRDHIRSWGFEPSINFVGSPDKFMAFSPFRELDLIIVDYNLGDNQHGEEFISRVREHGIFTEIIFYSAGASGELWRAVGEKQIEGVFVANKGTILEKIERVARQAVHKVLDLNNMRGIVMAEVGELDLLLESILRKGISSLGQPQREEIFARFLHSATEQAQKQSKALETFKAAPETDGLIALSSDSAKRWMNLQRLIRHRNELKGISVGDYQKEVLLPRNCLAHGLPEKIDKGYKFTHAGHTYEFNDETSLSLRHTILKYKQVFDAMVRAL